MKYIDIAQDVADKTGVPIETILLIYKKHFKFIVDKIKQINVKEIKSFDDYRKYKLSFNLQHLGKFYLNYKIIKKYNESIRNTTDVQ